MKSVPCGPYFLMKSPHPNCYPRIQSARGKLSKCGQRCNRPDHIICVSWICIIRSSHNLHKLGQICRRVTEPGSSPFTIILTSGCLSILRQNALRYSQTKQLPYAFNQLDMLKSPLLISPSKV